MHSLIQCLGVLVYSGGSIRFLYLPYQRYFLTITQQLIPQIVINYRRHHATGLQSSMMMLWAWAGVPLGVYNIVSNFNIALRIQPQILTVLSLVTWIQCYYYQRVCS